MTVYINKLVKYIEVTRDLFDRKKYDKIGEDFDELHAMLYNNRESIDYENVSIAINFLDAWIDSVQHDFMIKYKGIEKKEIWSELARELISNLENGENISNNIILKHFKLK